MPHITREREEVLQSCLPSLFFYLFGTISGNKITILNLFAPNEDYPQFFKNVFSLLAQKGEGMYLIGGDFNCVLDSNVDRLPAERGPQSLLGIMRESGLTDIW